MDGAKPSSHSTHTQSTQCLYDYAHTHMHAHTRTHALPSCAQLFQITLSAYVQGIKYSWGFISIYFCLASSRGWREKSTWCSFHYWPATKPVDEGKRALCWDYRLPLSSLCCLCCSAPRHAGDNRNHPAAGGKDLRPGWLLVSVRRLEHHRNPEEPESAHQDCLWVQFKQEL